MNENPETIDAKGNPIPEDVAGIVAKMKEGLEEASEGELSTGS